MEEEDRMNYIHLLITTFYFHDQFCKVIGRGGRGKEERIRGQQ